MRLLQVTKLTDQYIYNIDISLGVELFHVCMYNHQTIHSPVSSLQQSKLSLRAIRAAKYWSTLAVQMYNVI